MALALAMTEMTEVRSISAPVSDDRSAKHKESLKLQSYVALALLLATKEAHGISGN